MSIAKVCQLRKEYESFLLDDVSFSLEAGRIAGFIGRNGAGKTTTIKSMLNLVHPDGGEIQYFGKPLSGNEAEIKQQIGYSTGTVSWYPRKKIREIVSVTKEFYDTWDDAAYRRYLDLFRLDENKTPGSFHPVLAVFRGAGDLFCFVVRKAHGSPIKKEQTRAQQKRSCDVRGPVDAGKEPVCSHPYCKCCDETCHGFFDFRVF